MVALRTVGYENTSLEQFVCSLLAADVEHVIDIRELPLSRRKGFSKTALREELRRHGIRYDHLKILGDPKSGREAAKAGRLQEFRRIFREHLASPGAVEGLKLAARIAAGGRSALLCYEREHQHCHRAIVADALRLTYGFAIEHLDPLREGAEAHERTDDGRGGRNTGKSRASGRGQAR
jgi:uncharacterized protein (DUF488 family)